MQNETRVNTALQCSRQPPSKETDFVAKLLFKNRAKYQSCVSVELHVKKNAPRKASYCQETAIKECSRVFIAWQPAAVDSRIDVLKTTTS